MPSSFPNGKINQISQITTLQGSSLNTQAAPRSTQLPFFLSSLLPQPRELLCCDLLSSVFLGKLVVQTSQPQLNPTFFYRLDLT